MGDGLARVATQAAGWWSLARRWPRTDRSKSFRDCAGVSARSLVRSQAPSTGAKQSAVFLSSSARGAGMAAVAHTTVQDSAPTYGFKTVCTDGARQSDYVYAGVGGFRGVPRLILAKEIASPGGGDASDRRFESAASLLTVARLCGDMLQGGRWRWSRQAARAMDRGRVVACAP